MENKSIKELVREAVHHMRTLPYDIAKIKCEPIKTIVNRKLAEKTAAMNKLMGTNRRPVQIKVMSDFYRFRV